MPSTTKTITLITGANSGIGLALAHLLLASPSAHVLLGARSLAKGQSTIAALTALNLPGTVSLVEIDVSSEDSVGRAAREVEETYGRIDALVNNAAITGESIDSTSLADQLTATFVTNVVGPAITVVAFAHLLAKSQGTPRIINVSSGAGSITKRLDPSAPHRDMKVVPYRVSKAALHMVTACQAYEYEEQGWKLFNFCPGFTVSNLGPMNTAEQGAKPTIEGARPMLAILRGERDEEAGGFLNGTEARTWPW